MIAKGEVMAWWGIPDWTRVEAYPNPSTTTDLEWRWEFLRRRPDYREKWENRYAATKQRLGPYFYTYVKDREEFLVSC